MLVNFGQTLQISGVLLALLTSTVSWAKDTKSVHLSHIQVTAAEHEATGLFVDRWMEKCGDRPGGRTFTSCDGEGHLQMLDDALALGRKIKKHVLVEVGFEGCPPCMAFKNRLIKNKQAAGRFSNSVIVVPLDRYKLYQSHRSKLGKRGITSFSRVPKFYLLNYSTGSVIKGASGHTFGRIVMGALARDNEFYEFLEQAEIVENVSQQ